MTAAPGRPVLRYHGGKWMVAPWVIGHLPAHKTYVEAYGGAGSVLMRKARSYGEIFNDLDGDVVNVFRVLRSPDQASRLAEVLRLTPYARSEWRLAYEPADDPVERARRTVVRCQMGFGSGSCNIMCANGFRSHAARRGTTPALDWTRWPDEVGRFTERLRGVVIESRPAIELTVQHDGPGTCHYVDPPYVLSTRSAHTDTYAHDMDDGDHRELAAVLRGLEGAVVLSGYRCPLYDELVGDWRRFDRPTRVLGRERIESLWLNPRAARSIPPRLFE